MKISALSFLFLGLVSLSACGAGNKSSSQVKITNGIPLDDAQAPMVAWISSSGSDCTGTFVSDALLITAAHCIKSTPILYNGYLTTAHSVAVAVHPRWSYSGGDIPNTLVPYDLAVVRFPPHTAPGWSNVVTLAPNAGGDVTLVGWGANAWDGVRGDPSSGGTTLRKGVNRITMRDGNIIYQTGLNSSPDSSGHDATGAIGDSGGPMFIQRAPLGEFSGLVGVASGSNPDQHIDGRLVSVYVDLNSASSRSFIQSQGIIYH